MVTTVKWKKDGKKKINFWSINNNSFLFFFVVFLLFFLFLLLTNSLSLFFFSSLRLRTQTELVAVSDETVKQQNLKSQIGSQEAILEQKRMRVDRNIGLSQKDISSIKKGKYKISSKSE